MSMLMGSSTQVHSQSPLFGPAPASPVTVGPGSGPVLLADINQDGHLDLLTKHLLSQRLFLLLGDGNGHFASFAESPMRFGYQPGAIALADINNDKILDLGIASRDHKREYVHIFLGNGKGGFASVSGSPFTASASKKTYKPSLHFIDTNEDGRLDIVTANGRRNTLEILFGDARGGFSPALTVRLEPGKDRYSFALGDIDGDGHLDLVTASSVDSGGKPGRVVTKRGDGKAGFRDVAGSPSSVPSGPRVETLADVNGDRQLDLVLSHGTNLLSVLVNLGNGMFAPAHGSALDNGMQAFAVVAADVNRDRNADLVAATVDGVTAPFKSKIVVLLGDGRGFAPAPGSPFNAEPGAYNLAVGDVDEDGKLDIAASSFEGNAVTLLLGR